MSRLIALALVSGVLLLGMSIGAVGAHLFHVTHGGAAFSLHGGFHHHDAMHERFMRELDVTPEQREQIHEILRESRAKAEALHAELLPRVRAHVQQTRDRLVAVLTPEQRVKLEGIEEEAQGALERFLLER